MFQGSRLPVQRGIQVWSRLLISQAEVIVARGVLLVTVVQTRFRCCLGNRVPPKRVGNLKSVAEAEDRQKVPGLQKVLKVANQAEVTGPAAAKEAGSSFATGSGNSGSGFGGGLSGIGSGYHANVSGSAYGSNYGGSIHGRSESRSRMASQDGDDTMSIHSHSSRLSRSSKRSTRSKKSIGSSIGKRLRSRSRSRSESRDQSRQEDDVKFHSWGKYVNSDAGEMLF